MVSSADLISDELNSEVFSSMVLIVGVVDCEVCFMSELFVEETPFGCTKARA